MELARNFYSEAAIELPKTNWSSKPRVRRFDFSRFLAVAFLISALALVHVLQQALVAQDSADLTRTRGELSKARDYGRRLAVEKMVLSSPERLEQIAADQGLVRPTQINYIMLPATFRDVEKAQRAVGTRPTRLAKLRGWAD